MSETFSRIEVISGVARRRRFTTEQKLAIVAESMQPGMSMSYVARQPVSSADISPRDRPKADGIAEAFVKTFKRDYVQVNPIPDAATALTAIDRWMADCNEVHPHSRLAYRSPGEYRRAMSQPATCPV